MSDRDKYGNYINDSGVVIKINTDRNGRDHISFYGSAVDKPHDAVHVNVDYNNSSWNSTTHNADKSDTSHSSGGCYLTSACINHFNNDFDDNCEELVILRWFRDNFVCRCDIDHYYEVAPMIVDSIEATDNNESIYKYIYENVVMACVDAIKKGDYEFTYNRYKNSVLVLEEQFLEPKLNNGLVKTLRCN